MPTYQSMIYYFANSTKGKLAVTISVLGTPLYIHIQTSAKNTYSHNTEQIFWTYRNLFSWDPIFHLILTGTALILIHQYMYKFGGNNSL